MACISCLLVPRVLCCGSSLHLLEGSERATPTLGKTLVALAATSLCRHLKWANRRMCSACFGTIVQLLIRYWMVEKSCKHVFDQEKSGWVWPSTLCDISLCTEMTALIPEVEFFLTARMIMSQPDLFLILGCTDKYSHVSYPRALSEKYGFGNIWGFVLGMLSLSSYWL